MALRRNEWVNLMSVRSISAGFSEEKQVHHEGACAHEAVPPASAVAFPFRSLCSLPLPHRFSGRRAFFLESVVAKPVGQREGSRSLVASLG